ncbi:hypothetical protein GCWU000324_00700 [Kingella oralis ATCC 51147]|uniref:Uncharacterized protein n=1 Tax=Kingella oralis ATCC 51147 TaxID=629741 RepID=C4GEZ1_9NEIS|nr:hypothetical protein GCWU000324_00700 [Kingella oralis ATCC 51147]
MFLALRVALQHTPLFPNQRFGQRARLPQADESQQPFGKIG